MVGRLGNQLFQIANAYTQAKKYNRSLQLPLYDTNVQPYFTNVYHKLKDSFVLDKAPDACECIHTINGTFHFTKYSPHETKPTVFRGFFQSEKYFEEEKNNVKSLFSPTEEFCIKAQQTYPQLKDKTIAAINVRRGDYLNFPTRHPVVSLDYIYEAVKKLPEVDHYFVVSDDIEWCKQNIQLPNCIFTTFTDYEALWLLSLCHHFIISNSSFSWWGAYLSNYTNKIVISPDTWVGPDIVDDMKDIWCVNWIKIPTRVSNGYLILK